MHEGEREKGIEIANVERESKRKQNTFFIDPVTESRTYDCLVISALRKKKKGEGGKEVERGEW